MPSVDEARSLREYLLNDEASQKVFDRLEAMVSGAISRKLQEPNHPPSLSLQDEPWLMQITEQAGQKLIQDQLTENLPADKLADLVTQVMLDKHPLGPLMPLLRDKRVQNVHVNGPRDCFYFIDGVRYYARLSFKDAEDVRLRVIDYFNSQSKSAKISQANPIGTIILPTGERVHVAMGLGEPDPVITLRKHQPDRFANFSKLHVDGKAMPEYCVGFLKAVVIAKLNVLFCGGVNAGKTTWLRAFGQAVPHDERLGVIEDDRELFLRELREKTDTFEESSRAENTEGKGGIKMDVLIREALRQNANRMIVGEVRGKEALYMLKAMSSGWNGSACTIHADEAEDVLPQLMGYVFEHEDAPRNEAQVEKKISRAIHLIVFLAKHRNPEGIERRVLDKIVAVYGYGGDGILTQELVAYDELRETWHWVGPRLTDAGNDRWRRRFRNSGIDLASLIPQEVYIEGRKYMEDENEREY